MRRSVFTVVAIVATFAVTPPLPAAAVGPGGWDHVGAGGSPGSASLNGTVSALKSAGGLLYVGGNFTSAGGNTNARRIASWDGSTWRAIGGNTPIADGAVKAIALHQGKIYVGGSFTNAGGLPKADSLAVWNGATWAPFCNTPGPGPAFNDDVDALQVVGNTLYVGGTFQNAADIPEADYLVACDLTSGDAMSLVFTNGEVSGPIHALTVDSNDKLYVGGRFNNVADIPEADNFAAYSPTTGWEALGRNGGDGAADGAVDSFVRGLTAVGTDIYVGADSLNIAGIAAADHVARWDGTEWSALGSNTAGTNGWFPTSSFIYELTDQAGIVIAAGTFQNANGTAAADNIAYWDGAEWRPIGSNGAGDGPLPQETHAVCIFNGSLFAGGAFTSAGGDTRASFLAAHSLRLPDASIGAAATGNFVGNNVYSQTGTGQVRSVTVIRGRSVTSYVKIQNDGLVPSAFKVKGSGGARGITAQYFRGTANVSAGVRAGTYNTGTIAPRDNVVLRLVVAVANSSAASATLTTTATTAPQTGTATPPDATRVVVRATG